MVGSIALLLTLVGHNTFFPFVTVKDVKRELFSFCAFTCVPALIEVPRASPRACKLARTLLKAQKESNSLQLKREGSLLGMVGLCKKL